MIKWGIIGAGNIAHRFAMSLSQLDNAELSAIACRTLDKAKAFQTEHPCKDIFDDYQQLLDKSDVDVVYIALPHRYHFRWIKQAILANKAVLCEKPALIMLEETINLQTLLNERTTLFMEAMKPRFVPAYRELKKLIATNEIGEIKAIHTHFSDNIPYNAQSYHYASKQGGSLLDLGSYNLSLIMDLCQTSSFQVLSKTCQYGENAVDINLTAQLALSRNITATVHTAFNEKKQNQAMIVGTTGEINLPNFHRPTQFTVKTATDEQTYTYPYDHDDFFSQIAHFQQCLIEGLTESPIMPIRDTIALTKALTTIKHVKS